MKTEKVPYQKTVFVCTHTREEGRVACANPGRGGDVLLQALKDAVKAAGFKGKVRVARSGCLDVCEKGPNVFVFPSGAWHCGVSAADVPALMKEIGS